MNRGPHLTRDEMRECIVKGCDEFIEDLTDMFWEVQNLLEVQDAELQTLRAALGVRPSGEKS